jgi:large subunit ribosomal protein L25
MKKHSLTAATRTELGRKVKHLRKSGKLPATVYGKGVKSASVTLAADVFTKVYAETGETGLIELQVDKELRPVLVHNVQKDPVTNTILHIEFHQVDLKEKVHAKVPVEIVGEAPAVAQKLGVLLTVLNDIEVEALPTELPEKIEVDVTALTEVDQEVKVVDIKVGSAITVLTDGELTVVKVGPLVTKEAEAQAAAEEAAAAEAAVVAGGEAPAEGAETKSEDKSADAKPAEDKKS